MESFKSYMLHLAAVCSKMKLITSGTPSWSKPCVDPGMALNRFATIRALLQQIDANSSLHGAFFSFSCFSGSSHSQLAHEEKFRNL